VPSSTTRLTCPRLSPSFSGKKREKPACSELFSTCSTIGRRSITSKYLTPWGRGRERKRRRKGRTAAPLRVCSALTDRQRKGFFSSAIRREGKGERKKVWRRSHSSPPRGVKASYLLSCRRPREEKGGGGGKKSTTMVGSFAQLSAQEDRNSSHRETGERGKKRGKGGPLLHLNLFFDRDGRRGGESNPHTFISSGKKGEGEGGKEVSLFLIFYYL